MKVKKDMRSTSVYATYINFVLMTYICKCDIHLVIPDIHSCIMRCLHVTYVSFKKKFSFNSGICISFKTSKL